MEHHLSIFRPYERDAGHEDQLTRAALIVLKFIPLAHDAFLDLVGCGPLATLPRPAFDMQTATLVPPDTEFVDEIHKLVSVLLGPHEGLTSNVKPDLSSDRAARYDGVIQYGAQLLVVVESKLHANASDRQALNINTGGLRYNKDNSHYIRVRWQDLLDRWMNLKELGLLAPAENEILNDFFDNAEANFGDLLPYSELARCGDHPARRLRRLRALVEQATGLAADIRGRYATVRLPQKRVVSFDRVSLYVEGEKLILSAWLAELAPQYARVYSDPQHIKALVALANDPAWHIAPNFHLAYWQASGAQRWYPKSSLEGREYLQQWLADYQDGRAGRKLRPTLLEPEFRSWLMDHGYADAEQMEELDEWANRLPMDKFDIRPSVQVTHSWQWADAVTMDAEGRLVSEVRQAVSQLLQALREPSLPEILLD